MDPKDEKLPAKPKARRVRKKPQPKIKRVLISEKPRISIEEFKDITYALADRGFTGDGSNKRVGKERIFERYGVKSYEYWRMYNQSVECREFADSLRMEMTAEAESVVRDAVRDGDLDTSKWVLERTNPAYRKQSAMGIQADANAGTVKIVWAEDTTTD